MKSGTIILAAKEDSKTILIVSVVLLSICLLVFGFNWKYFYNITSGPYELQPKHLEELSAVELVKGNTQLIQIGNQSTTLKLKRLSLNKRVSAKYMLTMIGNSKAIIKVPSEHTGNSFVGTIKKLPEDLKDNFGKINDLLPLMVDCEFDYYYDINIILIGSIILFPLLFLFFIYSIKRFSNVLSHPSLSQFRSSSSPLLEIGKIESELISLEHNNNDGPLYFSDSWIVMLADFLYVFSTKNVIGYGVEIDKSNKKSLVFWVRGKLLATTLSVKEEQLPTVLSSLTTNFKDKYKEDYKAFDSEWSKNRKTIESKVT